MNTALSWIKAYVKDLNVSDQEYTDAMTLTGTKVEGFERLDKNLEKIVIGQVVKTEKHPDADFIIMNGNRVLFKRVKFEIFLDQATTI